MRQHEDVCIFYGKQLDYRPVMWKAEPYDKGTRKAQYTGSYNDFHPVQMKSDEERFPTDTLYCKTAESEEVQDRLKPEHLKIRNQNSGRSTLQWTLLCFLAKTGGELS